MASCSEVLSFLRILTSNSLNTTPVEKRKGFDEVLQSNLKRLRDILVEKGRSEQLRERLESKMNVHSNESCANVSEETEDCRKDISRKDTLEKESRSGKEDLTRHKDAVRWAYVEVCLELLQLLKDSLIELKKESDRTKVEPKPVKRGSEAPPLPADSLGVGDQKTVLTAIQFVVILGICPNLFPGVGLPLEKRTGFARLLNIQCTIKSERRLFQCVDTLVECIAQSSLGSLVLLRHLGDILSGLLQICYAPLSAYLDYNKPNAASSTDVSGRFSYNTGVFSISESHSSEITCKGCKSATILKSETKDMDQGDFSIERSPSDVYKLGGACSKKQDNDHGLFITTPEREKCLANLQRILDRVYQPIVIRELLILQGSPVSTGKPFNKDNSVTSSVSGEKRKPEKHAVLSLQTPKWMRSVCGQLLSERLMKPNGVKAVLSGVLERSTGAVGSYDWQKCEVIAKVIANCPSQAESVEQYYQLLSPQVLQLLHGQSAGVGRLFIRAASSIVREMLAQYPELTQKYILSSMLEPLAKTTTNNQGETTDVFINELSVMRCIEDVHKVFVVGSQTSALQSLLPIVHPLFELFCFTRKGVSHLRSALQEILVHVLKHADQHEALTVLYTLAFKHSPPQNSSSLRCPSDANKAGTEGRENFCVNLMSDNFLFANGDDGGVVIKVQNLLDDGECDGADGILRNLRGHGLSASEVRALCVAELLSDLKKDSVAGDFFIYLMQELTNVTSDFSDDMNYEEIQQSLLILHLVAVMCEKLGPSMLKNTPQTLAFILSSLKRACTILQADQEGLGTAFVTETLTMSLGMLSAVLGGAVEVKKEHQALIQDLLPLLDTLADSHLSVEVQDMANDLRIAIATHGAVWSHKVNDASRNLGKQTSGKEMASGSACKEGKLKTDLKEETSSPSQAATEFDEAFAQLCDPFLPVRGHAMVKLASLLHQRDPKAVESADTLLKIFLEQLTHDDSYIYLAAIQGLVSLADIRADTVIPHLTHAFATCRKEATGIAAETKDGKEKGHYMPRDKVLLDSRRPSRSPEFRMKLGEALVKATRNCGELVPRFSQHLLPALLTGVKDPEPLVRASSLSNLGDVCQLLRFSLGPVVNEIFSCLSAVLKTDKSAEVRRAAVLVVTLLLRGLGKNIMEVLSSTLKETYQLLKFVESTDADDLTRVHAQTALGELDVITRDYLFPKPSFAKRIQVLP